VSEAEFVHRFVPGSTGGTLLVLHGTGGDENDLVPLARELAPGANLLAPRGRVLEHGMPRFFRRLAVGVFDEQDLIAQAAELADFLTRAATRYGFDPRRLHALGYSNGANMAAALLLLHPDVLAGAVLLRAVEPLVPAAPPRLDGKSVLLVAGRSDPYAPAARVEALARRLGEAGAGVELVWSEAGHGLQSAELATVGAWLAGHAP
jgi:phospholipase/carboxylesterase